MLPVRDAAMHALNKLEPKILGSMPNITATTSKYPNIINKLTA